MEIETHRRITTRPGRDQEQQRRLQESNRWIKTVNNNRKLTNLGGRIYLIADFLNISSSKKNEDCPQVNKLDLSVNLITYNLLGVQMFNNHFTVYHCGPAQFSLSSNSENIVDHEKVAFTWQIILSYLKPSSFCTHETVYYALGFL